MQSPPFTLPLVKEPRKAELRPKVEQSLLVLANMMVKQMDFAGKIATSLAELGPDPVSGEAQCSCCLQHAIAVCTVQL